MLKTITARAFYERNGYVNGNYAVLDKGACYYIVGPYEAYDSVWAVPANVLGGWEFVLLLDVVATILCFWRDLRER